MLEGINYLDLPQFLIWLAGPAGTIAWGLYWSDLYRNLQAGTPNPETKPLASAINKFLNNQTAFVVQLLQSLGYASGPVIALVILNTIPPEVFEAYADLWRFLAVLANGYIGNQLWYNARKDGLRG